MCTFLSKSFSLSSISQDSLIQIPCYVQPALGPPRSCLLPRPALKKAGTDSKNLSIREGKWSTAQFQPDSLQTGRTVRAALCRDSAAGQSQAEMSQVEENGCWDAQKVMEEEQESLTDFPVWHSKQLKIPGQGITTVSSLNCFWCQNCSRGS